MRDASAAAIEAADVQKLLSSSGLITLVAQPIADLKRGVVVGYELLSRFALDRPAPPDRVFAAAEAAGLGPALEATVITRALALAARRPPNCFVTVNVDPRHLSEPVVREALEAPPSLAGVVVELTEHGIISDLGEVRATLDRLRERGALTAIDDAGAGYSGLKQILELRPQFLKIDRDLVTALHQNEAKRALVQMLGELAGRLDAWVIAEGVETEGELEALCQLGLPLGQGWLLGRPAPPWAPLSEQAAAVVHGKQRSETSAASVGAIVEGCAMVKGDEPWPDATLAAGLSCDGRLVELRMPALDGARRIAARDVMQVKRETSLIEAAARAATRSERLRWDPLVCIDGRGRVLGVVPMQRLVLALAGHAPIPQIAHVLH